VVWEWGRRRKRSRTRRRRRSREVGEEWKCRCILIGGDKCVCVCTVLYCVYRETDRKGNREWMDGREHGKREPRIIIIEIKTQIRIIINMQMEMGVAPPPSSSPIYPSHRTIHLLRSSPFLHKYIVLPIFESIDHRAGQHMVAISSSISSRTALKDPALWFVTLNYYVRF
jgi:hypothetical protein